MLGPLDFLIPPALLLASLATLPFTIIALSLTGRRSELTDWSRLKHAWFKHLWWWFGPASKPLFAPAVRPIIAQARGKVLEIGPASGIWMHELGMAVASNSNNSNSRITKIYGVEPNVRFHRQLLAAAKQEGLEDIYEPLAAYAEDLESIGISKGSVDTIITVHVLCSVGPQLEQVVGQLYEYLKPGGQWLVYEHVASTHALTRGWQDLNNTLWPLLLDNCNLVRSTERVLRNAGEWEHDELGSDPRDGFFEALPHCVGRLVKKI